MWCFMKCGGSLRRDSLSTISWRAISSSCERILVLMASSIPMIDPAQNEFLASLEAKSKKPSPFFRTMAQRPEALKTFVPFYGAVAGPGSVDRRTKELVYLTVSYTNRCAFCTAAHVATGRRAGITDDEMKALEAGRD